MKSKNIILSLLFLLTNAVATAQNPPELEEGRYIDKKETEEDQSQCKYKPVTDIQMLNGILLRDEVAANISDMVQKEKAQGRNPKVLVIGRAGQDFSGIMVLKDKHKGKQISVHDIFNEINPHWYNNDISAMQTDIKKEFGDKNRKLKYSHVGFLVIDHPIKNTGMVLNVNTRASRVWKGEALNKEAGEILLRGEFWVEELLKPCASLTPNAWATGLSMFFMDDPHDYLSILMMPRQDIQDKLYHMLVNKRDDFRKYLGHTYNAAAGAFNLNEQNSNQYILEMIAAAASGADLDQHKGRADSVRYLRETGFRPTKVIANSFKSGFMTFKLFTGAAFNMSNGDHPYAIPYTIGEFVTELSIREYLLRTGLVKPENIREIVLKSRITEVIKDENAQDPYRRQGRD